MTEFSNWGVLKFLKLLLNCFAGQKNSKWISRMPVQNSPNSIWRGESESSWPRISKLEKWDYILQAWGRSDIHLLLMPQREKNLLSLAPSSEFPFGSWFGVGWYDLQALLYNPWHIWECKPHRVLAPQQHAGCMLKHPQLNWELVLSWFSDGKILLLKNKWTDIFLVISIQLQSK